ncbi:CheR family methyltransferase [Gemmatimonas sp.]|jgi:chemotaxis protein methyltransferase CheR|uniref:CheR family methyltransferase n=1 Tax=Gemmatimonas sp. TaxID=1962908 RepID=UPI0037C122C7
MTAPAATSLLAESELTPAQFTRITDVLHEHAGIRMREGKEGLVRARLTKRLRKLGLPDFDAYLNFVQQDPSRREFAEMIDALTTNKTSFLREATHFDFLRDTVFPQLSGPVRIWSAGCSSGEEPYTLAMLCNESFADIATRDVRILSTDISHRVLAQAKAGTYPADITSDVPAPWLQKYWTRTQDASGRAQYEAGKSLRRLVHFAKLNLMERWPMQGPFDAILCRNVMIYFDKATQQQLVERYWQLLRPGGHLFVGHSESLTGLSHKFRYVQPAVYVK